MTRGDGMKEKRLRGRCLRCRYTWHLRADGTLTNHLLWCGWRQRIRCEGGGLPPLVEG